MITEFGPLANPRLRVFADGTVLQYKWQILFMTVASGDYSFDAVQLYLELLRPLSGYKLCPGTEYPGTECLEEIRFQTKYLWVWGLPFRCLDAQLCTLWHVPNNVCHPAGDKLWDTCQPCQRLSHDINQLVERVHASSEGQKLARSSVQSNYPLKYLSPKSRSIRVGWITKEQKNLGVRGPL